MKNAMLSVDTFEQSHLRHIPIFIFGEKKNLISTIIIDMMLFEKYPSFHFCRSKSSATGSDVSP